MKAEIRAVLRLRTMQQKRVWESGIDYRVKPGNDRFGGIMNGFADAALRTGVGLL